MKRLIFLFSVILIAVLITAALENTGPLNKFKLAADTIPVKNFIKPKYWFGEDKVTYDILISSPRTGIAAYKKRDSAWVVYDSAWALKQLFYFAEQQLSCSTARNYSSDDTLRAAITNYVTQNLSKEWIAGWRIGRSVWSLHLTDAYNKTTSNYVFEYKLLSNRLYYSEDYYIEVDKNYFIWQWFNLYKK